MNHSQQSRAVRWLWAGAFRTLGVAGVLLGNTAFAQQCAAPAACTPPTACTPDCNQCQRIFDEAAAKLKCLNPGCCTPAADGCAVPPAAACDSVCNPDHVFGCGGGHGCLGCLGGGELGEPCSIMDHFTDECGNNCLKDRGWQIGGWTAFGYSNNPDGAFTGNGQLLNQRFEWDRFNLNQSGLYFGKVADGSDGIGFGGRVEFVYGVDGNEFQSFGNNPGTYDFANGYDHGMYEWAIPQLYAEVAVGNHSVKAGHFYTLLGYEVLPTGGNFFFSKQLTFYNSEPFTHTGVLVASKVNDKLTLHNGWVLGMDTGFDEFNGSNAYHGGFIYNVNENVSFTDMMVFGNLGWRGNGFINSSILSVQWTEKLQTVHQLDFLGTDLRTPVPGPFGFLTFNVPVDFAAGGVARDSIGQINYAFYELNPQWKAGIRQEWYKADSISYYTLTYGLNFRPTANLVIRPEVRHMWSPGNDIEYVNSAGGTEGLYNQTVFGIDAVITY
jgi:hypothetical protein